MQHIQLHSKICYMLIIFIISTLFLPYFRTSEGHDFVGFYYNYTAYPPVRGVIVSLIRSTTKSIALTINMIHSVVYFHQTNGSSMYPFLIFHDENFTELMRERIRSCVLKTNKNIQISFALVNFTTNITINPGSPSNKPIGYRLMCRFWTYDVFYHPTIIQGNYDYLMRMDDDSYFSNFINYDIFLYMKRKKKDYVFRSNYIEDTDAMNILLERSFNRVQLNRMCIYNNFFAIRLKWYYESKEVQRFIHTLVDDDLILREYIGDGCAHAAMLKLENDVKTEHLTDISYGHNSHIMLAGRNFYHRRRRLLLRPTIIICLLFLFIYFWSAPKPISPSPIDTFLNSTLCGRLIRYPSTILTKNELAQLNQEAAEFFSYSNDCSLFRRPLRVSTKELTYPLAFTILIHSNLNQFNFLLRTIYRRHNYYCIHVDSKSPSSLFEAVQKYSRCASNIVLPEKRINVTWGDFSVLEAEHLCQKELLKQSRIWKYYFNLANSDVPLKTNFELVQILKLYNNQNDITSLPYRTQNRQRNVLLHRTLPPSILLPLYKGEFHVLLTRESVEYIHESRRVADLYNFLNGTIVPDEHFYSIINRWEETPGFYPYDHDISQVSFMTRYKIWNDRPEHSLCNGGFIRGICVFNHQDLWHLATSPHLFGNKIFIERDQLTPYCMAQYLDVRTSMKKEENDFRGIDIEFYKQLNNVRYGKRKLEN